MKQKKRDMVLCSLFFGLLAAGFLLCVFLPKAEFSYSERRELATLPRLTEDAVSSGRFMSGFERFATDTFPFRDSLRKVKAFAADKIFRRLDQNGLYETDGFLASMEYPLQEESLDYAARRFRHICEKYLTEENRVFLSVIPDKNCFLAPFSGHLSMDYVDFEKRMAKKTDFAEYISVSGLLERDDYYKTDTHWRQERIADVAYTLAEAMGAKISQEYEIHTLTQDFYGVYYGQAALPMPPETIYYLTGEAMGHCEVYDWQNRKEIPVYDTARAVGEDPYEAFLSGPLSLVTIKNQDADTDKRLVLFRDSFGASLAPLLISGYSEMILADIRYIHPDTLGQFIDFSSCDVLFLYSTLVLNHSETLK